MVAPFIGFDLRPRKKRFHLQLESRWLGVNFAPDNPDIAWVSPGGAGAISTSATFYWTLGKK